MPQHLWIDFGIGRACESCRALQVSDGGWKPDVHPVCPGGDDDPSPRAKPRPRLPSGSPRVTEAA
jgi:hypothetical protein